MDRRLSLAVEKGQIVLPDGPLLVLGATRDSDLSQFDPATTCFLARYRDVHDWLLAGGWQSLKDPAGPFAGAVLFASRARATQRATLRLASERTTGPVVVDGTKTSGIDAFLREIRSRADVSQPYSKAHGKVFAVRGGDFSDWPEHKPALARDGWWRAPGVFSADGIDRASALLAAHLPGSLPGRVADLGAGWGHLATAVLDREGVVHLDLIENDCLALAAAQKNIRDPRAAFEWADALTWRPASLYDHVVMNPPFHASRHADPEIGQAFIRSAASMLSQKGSLWLVANRHLPYERLVEETFRDLHEIGSDPGFKIIHATRPRTR